MVEQLVWSAQVSAANGPRIAASGKVTVEAYDKLTVIVTAGASQQVELGPSTTGTIRCLIINPLPPAAALTYDVGGTAVALDEPHFLLGGAVDLAGNPASLTFTNGTAADAQIEILVGRDATP